MNLRLFKSQAVLVWTLTLGLGIPQAVYSQGFFSLSEEQEVELGRQASIEVEKEHPILEDRIVSEFVTQLGEDLVRTSGRSNIEYQFKVVDSSDINAFALPGGFIYLNRGVIEAAANEGEVAGVMAHEIGHVVGKHSAEQVAKVQLAGLGLGVLGAILGQGSKGQIANVAAQLVTSGIFMKYSREAEREADRLGAQNMYDAGYDPRAMVTFFNRLAERRENEPNAVEKFFASHPSPDERADNISDLIASFPSRRNYRPSSRDFLRTKQRLADVIPPPVDKTGSDPSQRAEQQDSRDLGTVYRDEAVDRQIAAQYAPNFHVGITANPRYELPTNFDFDGDYRADNNWRNADSTDYRPRAFVYYSLSETENHLFIHYTLYFPVDDRRPFDARGRAFENDTESCLVIVEKESQDSRFGRVVAVEALGEDGLVRFVPGASIVGGFKSLQVEDGHPQLYVNPEGHRISGYLGNEAREDKNVQGVLAYEYGGSAEDPTQSRQRRVGYELVPLYRLWSVAGAQNSEIFEDRQDYGRWTVRLVNRMGRRGETTIDLGPRATTFRTGVRFEKGGILPWALADPGVPENGRWFLDPAWSVGEHFRLDAAFSRHYVHHPMMDIYR